MHARSERVSALQDHANRSRRESNPHLRFRKPPFYPLNYGNNFKGRMSILTQEVNRVNRRRNASSHQRDEPAAAGDFELAKDHVEMLFHHLQTQAAVISYLLITPPTADKTRIFL